MGKIKHKCKNCGIEYENYKEKSDFCSKECREQYNHVSYNCDTCNKPFITYKRHIIALNNGERHGIYCSRECADIGNQTFIIKECLNCGKKYKAWNCVKDTQKFCCRDCFNEYKEKNAHCNQSIICPICNTEFYPQQKNSVYCSRKCSGIAQRKRVVCNCSYCGKEIERKESDYNKNNKNYCSRECKWLDMQWSKHDLDILKQYYRKIPNKDIIPLLNKEYSEKAIRSQAGRSGLYESRLWSDEENKILIDNYSNKSSAEMMRLLPKRSKFSIIDRAISLGIKSMHYLNSIYSDEENLYLKDNYLLRTNEELGKELNRSPNGIAQHLYKLGFIRPTEIGKYKNIQEYIRSKLSVWSNKYRKECNYACSVSGVRSNIIVHHIRGFNLLLNEAFEDLNFKIKDKFEDYAEKELEELWEYFYNLQELYGEYCCVTENIHKLFHNIYGYGNNTKEQWDEFVEKYHNGEYKLTA